MRATPLRLRPSADRDYDEIVDYYLDEAGMDVAAAFMDAVKDSFGTIAAHPAAGSPRHAHQINLPGLRGWRVKRFPYIIFYMVLEDHVDVWRILHGERDIPATLTDPGEPAYESVAI